MFARRLVPLVFALVSIATFALAVPIEKPSPSGPVCNGHAQLCDRKYGNTTFLGSHDSFAVSGSFFALARNQEIILEKQLQMGVRMLQAQSHMNNGALHFCHTSCGLFDGGSVENYLMIVKKFLDANPSEVLTLVFTNPEGVSASGVWAPLFERTGIASMAYVPPQPVMTREDWPTLGSMINSGKRVVIFLDRGATEKGKGTVVPYILPQFKMMWEDAYDPTDSQWPCKVERTKGPLAPNQQLNLMNHNLNVELIPLIFGKGLVLPDRLDSPRTNGVAQIVEHANHCSRLVNFQYPNFVMLDFVNIGRGVDAVKKMNGLS